MSNSILEGESASGDDTADNTARHVTNPAEASPPPR